MTDDPKPTPEDELRDAAREAVQADPEPVSGAEDLPADVPDEKIEDPA